MKNKGSLNKNFKKRLFIAIDLPEKLKKYIFDFTSNLFKEDRDIKRVSLSNIHITLKFLGDINLDRIEKIKKAISKTAEKFVYFNYEIDENPGAFPDEKNARVIYISIGEASDYINKIYKELEDNLCKEKITKEGRKFIPHITIARIRGKKNLKNVIDKVKIKSHGKIGCSKITLFESKLKNSGAEYIIIDEFILK